MKPPEIKILPDDVANKIAAGEVVERPASVVKELLENSVDAGATRIDVEFKHGGKTFIKVLDNGCGMTRQQALTSLEQHATSKIRNPDDLFSISTYGFRGEAVPSIASVSKFRLRTRPEGEQFGTQIDSYASEILSVRECGMPCGTEILVENLFAGVPARRKFLKGDSVEAGHIARLCRLYALALPNLSITLVENSRTLFRSTSGLGVVARVAKIFGTEVAEKLVELPEVSRGSMKVSGAIVEPAESFPTSRNICTFINGRPVDCRAVYAAVKEAYAQYIPKGRFAAAFLFLELDPTSVDVNVHPAKREVRLKDEFAVKTFLADAIGDRLAEFSGKAQIGEMPDGGGGSGGDIQPPAPAIAPVFTPASQREKTFADFKTAEDSPAGGSCLREPFATLEPPAETDAPAAPNLTPRFTVAVNFAPIAKPEPRFAEQRTEISAPRPPAPFGGNPAPARRPILTGWRYVGCALRKYALFETSKSLTLMNISAALRRVNFNKIMTALDGRKAASQNLLLPITIGFAAIDDEFFAANRPLFESCGFAVEEFGRGYYRITATPVWLPYGNVEKFIRDFVETCAENGMRARAKRMGDEIFAKLAVEHIGTEGFECTEMSATNLLSELLECPVHMTSPDGRKTLFELSDARLTSAFGGA